jgi:hypothetical protein
MSHRALLANQLTQGGNMTNYLGSTFIALSALAACVSTPLAYADDDGARRYAVTITNITRGQILSPAAVIAHNDGYKLFTLGAPATAELATLAEDGNPISLVSAAAASGAVYQAVAGTSGIPPGASVTIEIDTTKKFDQISVASMLITTNDAFAAIRGISVPRKGSLSMEAEAYDSGTEANSENCAYIPGPPCGNSVHDPAPAEGFVHVHAGIHGGSSLNPAKHDWRNPVAHIEIRRIE